MTSVLRLDGVWKGYTDWSGRPRTLRGMLLGRVPVLRAGPRRWALRDVSLELPAGRSLGIVGHNGAGKSTLLRLASGLGRPTRGTVAVDPDSASVLNLGATFDGELTGRENAYTAALVAGHSSAESRRLVPQMLAFAEIEDFASAPVRTYSDGMRLRLAFGVIAAARPRLLVLDEVLAVGDIGFRRKCRERIADMREAGTSLVLVSHSLEEVRETCDEAAWLHRGALRARGETEAVLEAYASSVHERTLERTPAGAGGDAAATGVDRLGSQEATVEEVALVGAAPDGTLAGGAGLKVRVRLRAAGEPVPDPIVVVSLRRASDGALVMDLSTRTDGVDVGRSVTEAEVELDIDRLELSAGAYVLDVGVFERTWEYAYDFHRGARALTVEGRVAGSGVLHPSHAWSCRA